MAVLLVCFPAWNRLGLDFLTILTKYFVICHCGNQLEVDILNYFLCNITVFKLKYLCYWFVSKADFSLRTLEPLLACHMNRERANTWDHNLYFLLAQELERVTSLQTGLQLAAVICTNGRRYCFHVVKSTMTIICRVPFSEQTCNLNLRKKGLFRIPTDLLII